MRPCPLCARSNSDTAGVCSSCGVRMTDDLTELDPNTREMWFTFRQDMKSIRNMVSVLVWVVVAFAVLSLVGGYVWYSKVANGTIGGF